MIYHKELISFMPLWSRPRVCEEPLWLNIAGGWRTMGSVTAIEKLDAS